MVLAYAILVILACQSFAEVSSPLSLVEKTSFTAEAEENHLLNSFSKLEATSDQVTAQPSNKSEANTASDNKSATNSTGESKGQASETGNSGVVTGNSNNSGNATNSTTSVDSNATEISSNQSSNTPASTKTDSSTSNSSIDKNTSAPNPDLTNQTNSSKSGSTSDSANQSTSSNTTSNDTGSSSGTISNTTSNHTGSSSDTPSNTTSNETESSPDTPSNTTSNDTESSSEASSNTTSNETKDKDDLDCPEFVCSALESGSCLESSSDSYTLHPCPSSQTCDFSFYNLSNSSCVASPTIEPFQHPVQGNSTSNCSKSSDCRKGTICINGFCRHKRTEDSPCTGLDHCEDGTVCNKNRCVEYFSVQPGEPANYSLACQSGILLNGVCQSPELTLGDLPKKCESHKDCLASDGTTNGTCVCVYDEQGSSYCRLHRSDPLALEHLKHAHEGNKYSTEYYTRIFNVYPVNLFAVDCLWNNSKEMVQIKQVEEYAQLEAANGIVWFGVVWVVVS